MKKKTIIRLSITLIVIAALALWINSRWSAWFHNEAELPYAPQSEPGRVLLLSAMKTNCRAISAGSTTL